jgi:hypothetical protein
MIDFLPFCRQTLGRLRILAAVLLSSLLLSGCVQYNVGVNFEGQHHGAIVQHIKLGEQLTSFSNEQAQEWLRSIERRAQKLQGKTQHLSDQEIVVTIPFSNGDELESKINQFFNPSVQKKASPDTDEALDLPTFKSEFHLKQGNFLLLQRNRLSYDLDLRSLGVVSAKGNVIVSPNSLLDLTFTLNTPWGAQSINTAENAIRPDVRDNGHQLVWTLQPGQQNHIEAAFWLPSPLGLGTLLIVVFVLIGFYLKYQSFPWTPTPPLASTNLSDAQSLN